jgi:hypothetical protein
VSTGLLSTTRPDFSMGGAVAEPSGFRRWLCLQLAGAGGRDRRRGLVVPAASRATGKVAAKRDVSPLGYNDFRVRRGLRNR